jgi:uncharacterized protein (DUF433 family)
VASSHVTVGRITLDPAICHGQPAVRGLRYPVQMLLELLSSGMSVDEVLADYPSATATTCSLRWS